MAVLLNKDGFSSPLFDFTTFINIFLANADPYKYLKFSDESWGLCENHYTNININKKRRLKEAKPSELFTDDEPSISFNDPFYKET